MKRPIFIPTIAVFKTATVGGLALIFAGVCMASPIYSVQLQESVVWSPGSNAIHYDSGILNQTSLQHVAAGSGAGSFASVQGSIDGSQIHGFVTATTTAFIDPLFLVPGDGQAFFRAAWIDAITVGGLAPGTPISIRVTNSLHSSVSLTDGSSGVTGNLASAFSALSLSFPSNPALNPKLNLSNTDANPQSGTQTTSTTFNCFSGGTTACFTLSEILTLQADALGLSIKSQVDASNTNDIFIDVLTPGGTLSAASGVTYSSSTAVPEPSTAGLLLAGFAGVFVLHGRSRKLGRT
jgi:hypothetical protein